ncbi:MAG: proteophosphoglycan precursor [Rhodospirillaceae bacterium]|nr:proteophosphoglycan precursor [Rhodospirillaceae bacterium]OUT77942.1 MAG: hypothetical protein CBB83_07670 [Rhodospirillaceae bacterium TMED23]|tara:strand:- start:15315 stop:15929 length:615 start_codon:yes stop_codon:yes gene_type:complete
MQNQNKTNHQPINPSQTKDTASELSFKLKNINEQTLCGDIDIHINYDGLWLHDGSPIGRIELVKLFSSILEIDLDGQYWLCNPVEKVKIKVDDVPFQAVEINTEGKGKNQNLTFRTNVDEYVIAGKNNPIRIETNPNTGEPAPYVMIRDGLEARLTRSVFYHLINHGVERIMEKSQGNNIIKEKVFGVWSMKKFFQIGIIPDEI